MITIDESGINIKGLDLLKWTDIVGLEGVPDDDHTLFLHTAPYGKLLLHHPADELYKVFNHYLNQQRDAELNQATLNHAQNSTVAAFEFKATLFNWPIFLTVIIFGYLIGIAVTGLLLFYANIGFFKNMLAIFLLAPICAYLVWTIPFWQISHFAGKRTKKFVMTQDKLSSKDKAIEVYLLNTKVTFHHKTGIGYKLDFMTIISQNGRRLDLLVEQEELATLQKMQPNDINQQY